MSPTHLSLLVIRLRGHNIRFGVGDERGRKPGDHKGKSPSDLHYLLFLWRETAVEPAVWPLQALRFRLGVAHRLFQQVLRVASGQVGLSRALSCQGSSAQPRLRRTRLVLSGAGTMRAVFLCARADG